MNSYVGIGVGVNVIDVIAVIVFATTPTIVETGPEIKAVFDDNIITYQMQTLPRDVDASIVQQSLDNAISNWEIINDLQFQRAGNPDIIITWSVYAQPTHAGLAECYGSRCTLTIGLGMMIVMVIMFRRILTLPQI